MNLYEFVGSAPVGLLDPSGNFIQEAWGFVSRAAEIMYSNTPSGMIHGQLNSLYDIARNPAAFEEETLAQAEELMRIATEGDYAAAFEGMFPGISAVYDILTDNGQCRTARKKGEAFADAFYEIVGLLSGRQALKGKLGGAARRVNVTVKTAAKNTASKARDTASRIKCRFTPGGKSCFVAGTLVATREGMMAIETIAKGDRVWSINPETGEWGYQEVVEPLEKLWIGDVITISATQGEDIEATGNHPFWVVAGAQLRSRPKVGDLPNIYERGIEGRWVEARHIRVGDMLLLRSGESISVASLSARQAVTKVYNLHVADWHTYTVGTQRILVHNYDRRPNGSYEPNPKHGHSQNGSSSPGPKGDGQELLDGAEEIKSTYPKEHITFDATNKEIVVFKQHLDGKSHGFVPESPRDLRSRQRKWAEDKGLVKKKGNKKLY